MQTEPAAARPLVVQYPPLAYSPSCAPVRFLVPAFQALRRIPLARRAHRRVLISACCLYPEGCPRRDLRPHRRNESRERATAVLGAVQMVENQRGYRRRRGRDCRCAVRFAQVEEETARKDRRYSAADGSMVELRRMRTMGQRAYGGVV